MQTSFTVSPEKLQCMISNLYQTQFNKNFIRYLCAIEPYLLVHGCLDLAMCLSHSVLSLLSPAVLQTDCTDISHGQPRQQMPLFSAANVKNFSFKTRQRWRQIVCKIAHRAYHCLSNCHSLLSVSLHTDILRHALTQRSKGQSSRSHGYENRHGACFLVTIADIP